MVHEKEEKLGKKGTALPLAAFWKFAEALHMAKEPQITGRMLGNTGNQTPVSVSNIKKGLGVLFGFVLFFSLHL